MKRVTHYLLAAACLSLCATAACAPAAPAGRAVRIVAVEAVYGDIAAQLAGPFARVSAILASPSADPHTYEPTTQDATALAEADVVVENGLGYDAFADKLLAASPRAGRTIIVVGSLAGRRTGDNPHVWYDTRVLRRFSFALTGALDRHVRPHSGRFARSAERFRAWLERFARREVSLGRRYGGTAVAVTEPVFDAVLQAASLRIATPPSFAKAIEDDNDPAPQDVATMRGLLSGRRVGAFVYNSQTVEPSTTALLTLAQANGVAVVPVSETLPAGMHVQGWLDTELSALARALAQRPGRRHA